MVNQIVDAVRMEFCKYRDYHCAVGSNGQKRNCPSGSVFCAEGNLVSDCYLVLPEEEMETCYMFGKLAECELLALKETERRLIPFFFDGSLEVQEIMLNHRANVSKNRYI